jgi:hypothetical protein
VRRTAHSLRALPQHSRSSARAPAPVPFLQLAWGEYACMHQPPGFQTQCAVCFGLSTRPELAASRWAGNTVCSHGAVFNCRAGSDAQHPTDNTNNGATGDAAAADTDDDDGSDADSDSDTDNDRSIRCVCSRHCSQYSSTPVLAAPQHNATNGGTCSLVRTMSVLAALPGDRRVTPSQLVSVRSGSGTSAPCLSHNGTLGCCCKETVSSFWCTHTLPNCLCAATLACCHAQVPKFCWQQQQQHSRRSESAGRRTAAKQCPSTAAS